MLCPFLRSLLRTSRRCAAGWQGALSSVLLLAGTAWAQGANPLSPERLLRLQSLVQEAAQAVMPPQGRVEVEVGAPDPRLQLAACAQVEPFLPPGPLWGRSRVGLRCVSGPVRWSVTVPVAVRVFAPAWVARAPMPGGSPLQADSLVRQEAELSRDPSPAWLQAEPPLDRVLARPLQAGETLRAHHLKPRQWFAAGDTVQVRLQGDGFAVRTEGQAQAPGLEGQRTRIRLEGGRLVQAQPTGERAAEVNW